MYSNVFSAPPESRPVFARETVGNTLVLSPLSSLGSLNENDIERDTTDLLRVINHSGPHNIVFDLASSSYLGTAMLGAIVRLWKRVSQIGGRLALCNVSDQVNEVLRITKLHAVWPVAPSREAALGTVGA